MTDKPATTIEKIAIAIGFIIAGTIGTYLIDITSNECIIWCFLK